MMAVEGSRAGTSLFTWAGCTGTSHEGSSTGARGDLTQHAVCAGCGCRGLALHLICRYHLTLCEGSPLRCLPGFPLPMVPPSLPVFTCLLDNCPSMPACSWLVSELVGSKLPFFAMCSLGLRCRVRMRPGLCIYSFALLIK
jgi:hypothetical protein